MSATQRKMTAMSVNRPESAAKAAARRIGDATRTAQHLLKAINASTLKPDNADTASRHCAQLASALQDLVDAITAVSGTDTGERLTAEEQTALIEAGIPADAFTDEAIQKARDWLVWSSVTDEANRRNLDALADKAAVDIVPGLREVIDAFPDDYLDLDRFTVLTTPDEDLDGLSPISWLPLGRDVGTVTRTIESLEFLP